MPNATMGRASEVTLDGAFRVIPGFTAGAYQGDQLPFFIGSPAMAMNSAASNQAGLMVPFNATIAAAMLMVTAAPNAANTVLSGTRADPDHFLDSYSIATTITGLTDISSASLLVNTSIDAGDIVEFSTGGEATVAAQCAVTLICVPKIGA